MDIEPPLLPPYLVSPSEVIPIDVGRQLFVDDFLIKHTTMKRAYHSAEYHWAEDGTVVGRSHSHCTVGLAKDKHRRTGLVSLSRGCVISTLRTSVEASA